MSDEKLGSGSIRTCFPGRFVVGCTSVTIGIAGTASVSFSFLHASLLGESFASLDPLLVFPDFVLVIVIWAERVILFQRIPYIKRHILVLEFVEGNKNTNRQRGKGWVTFLFFPLPRFFLWLALKPFTSSSRTIEGGFTFFPHGWGS
jgi:hypothetical protein